MSEIVSRSRWVIVIFIIATLVSVVSYAIEGSGAQAGSSGGAASSPPTQTEGAARSVTVDAAPSASESAAAEDYLIDHATGDDPTPEADRPPLIAMPAPVAKPADGEAEE
jgi:hypothetical protein